jgi:hypothetical protein
VFYVTIYHSLVQIGLNSLDLGFFSFAKITGILLSSRSISSYIVPKSEWQSVSSSKLFLLD